MTPDLLPKSCFDPHMDFSEILSVFRVVKPSICGAWLPGRSTQTDIDASPDFHSHG